MDLSRKWPVLVLALLCLPAGGLAAPPKHPPTTVPRKKPPLKTAKPAPQGRPLRLITTRVTVFYAFKDKKSHKVHPLAAVSKTLTVKVFKRVKRK